MDKYEFRRLALDRILQTQFEGKAAPLAARLGKDASYVLRMLYPKGKKWKKNIGEDIADLIEATFNVPMNPSGLSVVRSSKPPSETEMEDSDSMIELLALWQTASEDGRAFILDSARSAEQRVDARWVKAGN